MKKSLAVVVLLLLPLSVQALGVRGAAAYKPYDPIVLKAQDVSPKAQLLWDVDAPAQLLECGPDAHVWAPPGTYKVSLIAVDFEAKTITRARFAFTVDGSPPLPPGPPLPPPPPPPSANLHVLILFESSAPLPAAQYGIIYGKAMRTFLDASCPRDSDGKAAYRIWDKDTAPGGDLPVWLKLLASPRTAVPWLVLGDGAGAVLYSGPLPADTAAARALIGKYLPSQRKKAA